MIGRVLSHYRILESLGEGGMGVVYRARDERLGREVAIKLLPGGAPADVAARRRFHQEAMLLSRINHPGIATLHDFGHDDGVDFLVMECVEGETLEQRLARGALPEREAAPVGLRIAEALEAAHANGVVHRDLKPANVALLRDGRIKVLDFGLATLLDAAETSSASSATAGIGPGTLRYMAPEQLLGGRVDARADLHALGAILYEMVTGRPPYGAALATALVYEIANTAPVPPGRLRGDLSRGFEELILRCLEKDPARRPGSAREVAAALGHVAAGEAAPRPAAERPRIASLAVLPLENLSGDPAQEFFADGMTDALIADLARLGALRVISRTSVMRLKGARRPLPEIARELGVDVVIEGTVLRAGDRVRIRAQLVDPVADRHLWSRSYQRDVSDVLELQAEVARAIVDEIQPTLQPHERARLARVRTVAPGAHEAYLRARYLWNQRTEPGIRSSIELLEGAVATDPQYAIAWSALADAYAILGTNAAMPPRVMFARAKEAATRALELDPMLGEPHVSLAYAIQYGEWDWAAAEREYRLGIALEPGYATGHQWYGTLLSNLGRFDEAIAECRLAKSHDPLALILYTSTGEVLYHARRYEEARAELAAALALDAGFGPAHLDMGRLLIQQERYDEAVESLRRGVTLMGADPAISAPLAYGLARAGREAEARAILDRLMALHHDGQSSPYGIAMIHQGLGDPDRAVDWLETAMAARDRAMVLLKVHPRLDPLRAHPRFADLLRGMSFPE